MVEYDYPEHYADSVWSAIKLAEELKESGDFDLFRGQRHTFDIQPSVLRAGADVDTAENQLRGFDSWVHGTPDLNSLHGNLNACLAVAQHYGLKTPLLDFSRSPRIAGFFATDGGMDGDTGTIICLNKKRFVESWSDINKRYYEGEGRVLTEIIDIDVRNLWRLQAQEGVFLRCHVAPLFLEMFSFFLHIYFPQKSGTKVIERENIYPTAKSHLEVLLDQYFLIDTYPERSRKIQEVFGSAIMSISEKTVQKDIETYFKKKKIPKEHESWGTPFANKWLQEPEERYDEKGPDCIAKLVLPKLSNPNDFEPFILKQLSQILGNNDSTKRNHINWIVVEEKERTLYIDGEGSIKKKKDKNTKFAVAEMVNAIYSGMRYLPYENFQIMRTIARYLKMISFDIDQVIDDPQGIELSGGGVRGRGFGSKRRIREALREDFFRLIDLDKLNASDEMNFRDMLFVARYVRSSYLFERFLDLFIEDLIPSQATMAVEGLIIGVNPMRVDVFGES